MRFSPFNHALLRGILAGAVVLTGTACSRPDRAESGSDTTAATLPDTSGYAPQPSSGDTASGAMRDKSRAPEQSSSTQPGTPAPSTGNAAPSNSPRGETAPLSDSDAAGYRPMERDTATIPDQHADSARVTGDSAAAADSATAVSVITDTVPTAETSEVASDTPDTTDSAGRIRPTEDSTEILGQVTTDSISGTDDLANETADEQVVNPDDQETVAASEAPEDEVGAAAVAGDVTGADAVALMSRQGLRCAVADPEANEAVRWDMSNTPVTLNPCGVGSMTLSRIWTEK